MNASNTLVTFLALSEIWIRIPCTHSSTSYSINNLQQAVYTINLLRKPAQKIVWILCEDSSSSINMQRHVNIDVDRSIYMWLGHGWHFHDAEIDACVTEHWSPVLRKIFLNFFLQDLQWCMWLWSFNQRGVRFCSLFPDVSIMLADVIFPSIK